MVTVQCLMVGEFEWSDYMESGHLLLTWGMEAGVAYSSIVMSHDGYGV
jgi:hypothetical protein